MKYIKSNEINPNESFFHFSRIDNRESIEHHGLQAVAGGENAAANDRKNRTIYFSKGMAGILKAVDVWARWEYGKYAREVRKYGERVKQDYEAYLVIGKDDSYDKSIMKNVIFNKLYNDFKNRQYYVVDLIEGKDFKYGDIDVKKILSRDLHGRAWPGALWKYGPYSDFGTSKNPNNTQEDWNMNTKFGRRTIPTSRLKILETVDGRSDALSVILEAYDKYRDVLFAEDDIRFEILDAFIEYARERYKMDATFKEGAEDYGRREVFTSEQRKYQIINDINTSRSSSPFSFVKKLIDKIKKGKEEKALPEPEKSTQKENTREEFIQSLRGKTEEKSLYPSDEAIMEHMDPEDKFYSFDMKEIDSRIRIPKQTKNGEHLYLYRRNIKTKQLGDINCKINSQYYIIKESGEIVGRVPVSISEPDTLSMDYWIKDEFQGQGIGSVVLEEVLRQIYKKQSFDGIDFTASRFPGVDKTTIKNIQLEISDDNDASIRIAEKNGFSKAGDRAYSLSLDDYNDRDKDISE